MILSGIVTGGDQLKSLIAIRDRLAVEFDLATTPRDIGILSKQLVEVLDRIAAIKPAEKSKVDELAEKRAKRRENAKGNGTEDVQQVQPE